MRISTRPARIMTAAAAAALAVSLAGCSGSDNDQTSSSSNGADSDASYGPVTKKQAGKIVTDKYGGQVKSVEADHEKGQATWEVEVKNSRKGRIEVDVTKKTGKIVAFERD